MGTKAKPTSRQEDLVPDGDPDRREGLEKGEVQAQIGHWRGLAEVQMDNPERLNCLRGNLGHRQSRDRDLDISDKCLKIKIVLNSGVARAVVDHRLLRCHPSLLQFNAQRMAMRVNTGDTHLQSLRIVGERRKK